MVSRRKVQKTAMALGFTNDARSVRMIGQACQFHANEDPAIIETRRVLSCRCAIISDPPYGTDYRGRGSTVVGPWQWSSDYLPSCRTITQLNRESTLVRITKLTSVPLKIANQNHHYHPGRALEVWPPRHGRRPSRHSRPMPIWRSSMSTKCLSTTKVVAGCW